MMHGDPKKDLVVEMRDSNNKDMGYILHQVH